MTANSLFIQQLNQLIKKKDNKTKTYYCLSFMVYRLSKIIVYIDDNGQFEGQSVY